MEPTPGHTLDLDLELARALALVRSRALLASNPVRARDARLRPGWGLETSLRLAPGLGEPKAPAKGELEAQIPETPAQMRELVQVLGPVAVTDLVQAALGPWPGLTRADVEAMVHRRFHGSWWAWDAPAG